MDLAKEMIKAAKHGNVAAIKALLATDPALIDVRDKDGSTPLHCATWKGFPNAAAALIEAGADVNAVNQNDHWGTTPLHAAAHANQAAIAEMLLAQGADLNAQDLNGKSPMHHTTFHKAKAAAKVLERYENNDSGVAL
jgi:ankyrin repeat protein